MSDLKANLKKLSKNPVFQMSLSAKELFHSNMLKMFLMQKDSIGNKVFPDLKNLFPPKNGNLTDYEILDVLREKEKFDLVIIYARKSELEKFDKSDLLDFYTIEEYLDSDKNENDIKTLVSDLQYVVIENKFKSVPDKKQLEEYSEKIKRKTKTTEGIKIFSYNKAVRLSSENTNCYLLAPNASLEIFFTESTSGLEWEGKSYEEYLGSLREGIKNSKVDTFFSRLVENYCSFVETMLHICESEVLARLNDKAFLSEEQKKEFKKHRIQDFYEKLSCSYLLNRLRNALSLEKYEDEYENPRNFERIISKTFYSLGQGAVEIGFKWKNCISTYLGLQNGELRIYVLASKDNKSDKEHFKEIKKKSDKIDEATKSLIEKIAEIRTSENEKSKNEYRVLFKDSDKKNKSEVPFSYEKDNYICKYGKIPISSFAGTETWREISYKALEEKVKEYFEKLKKVEPEGFFEAKEI